MFWMKRWSTSPKAFFRSNRVVIIDLWLVLEWLIIWVKSSVRSMVPETPLQTETLLYFGFDIAVFYRKCIYSVTD